MVAYIVHGEFRCSYPFKLCPNLRAVKKNGQPHKLCEEHRKRANQHQKNLAERRKQIKERLRTANNAPSGQGSVDHRLTFADIADLLDDTTFLQVDCCEDDLKAVEALLSDTESD